MGNEEMKNYSTRLKQIISTNIRTKKIPVEIEKIILSSNNDYAKVATKLIEALKTLDLNESQKEKLKSLEKYNENDCKEDVETLKYLALAQYENRKDDIIEKLDKIIDESVKESKKIEKNKKGKKINYKEIERTIKNKQENFSYASVVINNITDEIKSSKKGMLNYLNSIQFPEEEQKKVDRYVKRFEDDVQLIIDATVLKMNKIPKVLDAQDSQMSKKMITCIKDYSENSEQLKVTLDFQQKRDVFIENLQEKISDIRRLPNVNEEDLEDEKDLLEEIDLEEK